MKKLYYILSVLVIAIAAAVFFSKSAVFNQPIALDVSKSRPPSRSQNADVAVSSNLQVNADTSTPDNQGDKKQGQTHNTAHNTAIRNDLPSSVTGSQPRASSNKATDKQPDSLGTLDTSRAASEARILRNSVDALSKSYKRFFEVAGITDPNIQDKVILILADEQQRLREIVKENRTQGVTKHATQFAEENKATNAQLSELLGAENSSAIVDFRNSIPYRPIAEETAARAAVAGVSLSPAVVDELASALKKLALPVYISSTPVSQTQYAAVTARDNQAIAAAEKILTPGQLAVFKIAMAERIKTK